jgi:hypothetical protein
MAKRKWSVRSYNAFLKEAKAMSGKPITHKQAQQVYREMRDRFGKSLNRNSIRAHPRGFSDAVSKITVPAATIEQIDRFIEELDSPAMEALFGRHYGTKGFDFELDPDEEILKVSISTDRTRKTFSVRA